MRDRGIGKREKMVGVIVTVGYMKKVWMLEEVIEEQAARHKLSQSEIKPS